MRRWAVANSAAAHLGKPLQLVGDGVRRWRRLVSRHDAWMAANAELCTPVGSRGGSRRSLRRQEAMRNRCIFRLTSQQTTGFMEDAEYTAGLGPVPLPSGPRHCDGVAARYLNGFPSGIGLCFGPSHRSSGRPLLPSPARSCRLLALLAPSVSEANRERNWNHSCSI